MNYLAHLFLSGEDVELLTGNFIGDAVKGNQFRDYPPGISRGILMHRFIDNFSDHHEIALCTRRRLRKNFGLWSPVITDMYYDHFLAAGWNQFHNQPLDEYSQWAYHHLSTQQQYFPKKMKDLFYYMSRHNWLVAYASVEGISRSLQGLSGRVQYNNNLDKAGEELKTDYEAYKEDFHEFFPKLQEAVKNYFLRH